MGGDAQTIKERLNIDEVISAYVKLERAGANLKGRCPFHSEKTPSFFVSPARQSFYCFGCGMKGDIFTFIEEIEGMDFRESLEFLAEKAGVEIKKERGQDRALREEKDRIIALIDEAASFYQESLKNTPEALQYLESRGISNESVSKWRIGYARDEWRFLYSHLVNLGFPKELIIKAGLAKYAEGGPASTRSRLSPRGGEEKEPYDVFRGRVVFPLSDASGRIVAFSGRALDKNLEPKYLNSPDTTLFIKKELLYGLDKAKEAIRKKNYAVLVEGQMDLVLSHQAGVANTVASSGTAFTVQHLERLRKFSPRIILAFDGDSAGQAAAEKSAALGMSLGMEVKIAGMEDGKDPADLIASSAESWRDTLKSSSPAIEHFLNLITKNESDSRKALKLVEQKLLPLLLLLESSMERSHFVSLISKKTGLKEDAIWADLRAAKMPEVAGSKPQVQVSRKEDNRLPEKEKKSQRELIEERLEQLAVWRKEFDKDSEELELLNAEEAELNNHLSQQKLKDELAELTNKLSSAESLKQEDEVIRLSKDIAGVHNRMRELEESKKIM